MTSKINTLSDKKYRAVSSSGDSRIQDPLVVDNPVPMGGHNVKKVLFPGARSHQSRARSLRDDFVASLCSPNAETVDASEIDGDNLFNYLLTEHLQKLPNWKKLRDDIASDPLTATILVNELVGEEISDMLPATTLSQARDLARTAESWGDSETMIESLEELQSTSSPADRTKISEHMAKHRTDLHIAQKASQVHAQQLKLNFPTDEYFQRVDDWANAMGAVLESLEECGVFGAPGWGTQKPTNERIENIEDRLALAKKLMADPRLMGIINQMGKMKNLSDKIHKEKFAHARDEVVDIEMGGDLTRLLPSSILPAFSDKTKVEFVDNLLNKRLLQYRMEGKQPLSKGPIILIVDQSGSMQGVKEVWSKGLMGGILSIAAKQKRPALMIAFSTEMRKYDFKNPADLDAKTLSSLLSDFLNGGTNLGMPVEEACKEINEAAMKSKGPWSKADIIMISDGDGALETSQIKRVLAMKQQHNVTVQTFILKESDYDGRESLSSISDKIVELDYNILHGDTTIAGGIFENLTV